MLIIGLVGTSGAGKSTASHYLKNKGFFIVELSSFLKIEAEKRGINLINKRILQDIGNDLRIEFGPEILAKKAYEQIIVKKINKSVVDGIRNTGEIEYLRKIKNFLLIAIDADQEIRYKRIVKLRGKEWVGTYQDFLNIEKRDSNLGDQKTGLRVSDCLKMADFKIINNNKITDFYKKIDKIIESL